MTDNAASSTKQKLVKCYHCGNETLMNLKGEYYWKDVEEEGHYYFSSDLYYELYACPVCHNVSLTKRYTDDSMIEQTCKGDTRNFYDETTIYPMSSFDNKAVPRKIAEAFEAALKVKNIDNGVCLIALRKTLELVLCEKGAKKWSLQDKIEEIAAKGLLPEALKEASQFAKILGNAAAHGNDEHIDSNDVSLMTEFIKYILEYLYILPHKIETYKKKIEKQENTRNE
jgi:hypothetical protein